MMTIWPATMYWLWSVILDAYKHEYAGRPYNLFEQVPEEDTVQTGDR